MEVYEIVRKYFITQLFHFISVSLIPDKVSTFDFFEQTESLTPFPALWGRKVWLLTVQPILEVDILGGWVGGEEELPLPV